MGGWVYLTVIPGLFDRKVIGRALSEDMETVRTSIPALKTAFTNRKAEDSLILHRLRKHRYYPPTPGHHHRSRYRAVVICPLPVLRNVPAMTAPYFL
jgi:transposase InsO family protein